MKVDAPIDFIEKCVMVQPEGIRLDLPMSSEDTCLSVGPEPVRLGETLQEKR